jgi:hypothetical protein
VAALTRPKLHETRLLQLADYFSPRHLLIINPPLGFAKFHSRVIVGAERRLTNSTFQHRNALLQFGEGSKRLRRRPGVRALQQRDHEQELVLQPDDRLAIGGHGPDASVKDVLVFGIDVAWR